MTDPLDTVRAQLADLQDVDMGPVAVAGETPDFPADEASPPDGPPDGGYPAMGAPDGGDDSPVARAAREPINDTGNGNRLIIHFGDDLMFVPQLGWFTWGGTHWSLDASQLAVRAMAQQVGLLIHEEAACLPVSDDDAPLVAERMAARIRVKQLQRTGLPRDAEAPECREFDMLSRRLQALAALLKDHDAALGRRHTWANTSGNTGKIDAMMTESRTRLQVPYEALDAGPLDINTESGLLRFTVDDLRADGGGRVARADLIAHARDQRLTKLAPVVYDPAAPCPRWDAFLQRIQPDREMRMFLQRWLGLSMTAMTTPHIAFFYGSGANGKSVLVDTIAKVLGGYATTMKIESITGPNQRTGAQATPDLIPLVGARFVRVSEPDQGMPLQEGMVKAMTGGEPIPVRPNYGEQFLLDPTFKMTLSGNHKPEIKGGDDGIWRRVLLVPFDVQIPAAERDERLGERLWEERAGIFRWLCEGLEDVLINGLCPPAQVLDATAEYRDESDPMAAFLVGCCAITGQASDSLTAQRLVEAYNYYLLERGLNTRQPTTITKAFAAKSRQWAHPETARRFEAAKSRGLSTYRGLLLTAPFAARLDAAPRTADGRIKGPAAPDPDMAQEF